MKKSSSRCRRLLWCAVFFLLLFAAIYTHYDNNRFILVEQEIVIENLPASFDGFKILQISDLHGKYFGDRQVKLTSMINQIDYDALVFTGDMNRTESNLPEDSMAILDLIDGIENHFPMLWVDGNMAPYAIDDDNLDRAGKLSAFGSLLQAKGCQVLQTPYPIARGDDKLWFVPDVAELDPSLGDHHQAVILLTHVPKRPILNSKTRNRSGLIDYDLIIAGHYHGGQIRVPFIGALFIPSYGHGLLGGIFPSQTDVKGLIYVDDVPQYISAGLGASSAIPFLAFRLCNTPEINRITLRKGQAP